MMHLIPDLPGIAVVDQAVGSGDRRYVDIATGLLSPWVKNGKELRSWLADRTWTIERDYAAARLKAFDPAI